MTSQLQSQSLAGPKFDIWADKRGRIVDSVGVICGPFGSGDGSYTPTTQDRTGFAGATNVSVTSSRAVQNGENVTLFVTGLWAPNATSASASISLPTDKLPRAGVSVSPVGVVTMKPSNGTNASVVSAVIGAYSAASSATSPARILVGPIITSTDVAGSTSTYSAIINYNI